MRTPGIKFSDQKVRYFDRVQKKSVWVPLAEYIELFPQRVGVHNARDGRDSYHLLILLDAEDISYNPAPHERICMNDQGRSCVFMPGGDGTIFLQLNRKVDVLVSINIDWGD